MVDERVENLWRGVGDVAAEDERAAAPGHREVGRGLHLEVLLRAGGHLDRLRAAEKRGHVALDLLGRATVVVRNDDDRLSSDGVRVVLRGLGHADREDRGNGIWRVGRELAEDRPQLVDVRRWMDSGAPVQDAGERLELEFERGRDSEVRAGAPEAPEELGLLGFARPDHSTVCRDELDRPKVVDRQTELALEPADAAAERQPRNARVTDDANRTDKAVLLAGDVELAEQRTTACPGMPGRRIDGHVVQPREINDQTTVVRRVAQGAVTPAADGNLEVELAPEPDRGNDVIHARRLDDESGPAIEHGVPDAPCVVISG